MARVAGVDFCGRLGVLAVFAVVLVGMPGCKPPGERSAKRAAIKEANKNADAWRAKVHQFYLQYASGDYDQAKRSLERIIDVTECSPILPVAAAQQLWATYSRLYLIEKRCGHNAAARACMIKLRYWWLRDAELSGATPSEAMADIENYTSDSKVAEIFDRLDSQLTDGKGPAYKLKLHGTRDGH